MRFISPHPKFNLKVFDSEFDLSTNRPKRIGFMARFEPGVWLPHEREVAFERWGNVIRRGSRMLDQALTQPAPLEWRIGVFDTDIAIEDPDLRKRVEEKMLSMRKHGRDFVHVPAPQVPAPWPAYDDLVAGGRGRTNEAIAAEIAETVEKLGLAPNLVAAYERQHRNRDEVLEALGKIGSVEEPEKIEVPV